MDKINAFNERVASLGLNKVATLFAGAPLLTEATEQGFKFTHSNPKALAKIVEKIGINENYKIEGCDLIYDFSESQLNEDVAKAEETAATFSIINKAFYDAGWGRARTLGPVVTYNVPGEHEEVDPVTVDASSQYTIELTYKDKNATFNGADSQGVMDWINSHVGDFYAIGLNENFHQRHNLPQLELDKFIIDLKKYSIDVSDGDYAADELVPSQSEFNDEKIASIVAEKSWDKKPVVVSSDKVIVDGHHRWKAAFQANGRVKAFNIGKTFAEIIDFVKDKDYAVYKSLNEAAFRRLDEAHSDGEYISAVNHNGWGDEEARIYCCSDEEGKCIYNLQIVSNWGELMDDDDFDLLDNAVAHARDHGFNFKPEDIGAIRK